MKKIIVVLICTLATTNLLAQVQAKKGTLNDDKTEKQDYTNTVYKLFPTQNIWTFIKLNTKNGQMWQVQFDTKAQNRFETNLNSISLVTIENEISGRFTLYPTQNTWTFILLDQINGKTWQVQWSIEAKDRLIIPIE
ncbi:hypothetical protein [Flavobacterium daemonense]|uniref:hypothetical protein n=1 Tax=Flavobacterium daemonense TaxID=1393049 RepID=UPI001B8770B6|nr:hypothetical protein [Flavobacterium daemonense]